MEVRQLRHVLALVEHGNFHRASHALGLTQPALTKSLQQIERGLGRRLFDRHCKAVVPTVFGVIVARTARQVVDALDGMTRAIGQTADLEDGELSVGAGSYVADFWLGQVVGRLLRKHPRLRLALHVDHWSALPDLLRRGKVDLIVASVEHIQGRSEFRVVDFPPQRGICICRAGHPLAGRKTAERSALKQFLIISPEIPESIRTWLDAGSPQPAALERKINTTSVNMIKAMVREGDAVSLVHPDMVRGEIANGEFVTLEFDAPPLSLRAGLAWPADRSLSPAALAFVRELLPEVGLDPDSLLQ